VDTEAAKQKAAEVVGRRRGDLVALSHALHADPELGFEEERSAERVAGMLAEGDLVTERGVCELPTAFVSSAGQGPLTLAICAEYDALPGIGHACGHNVIAAAAVGAGLALAPLADDLGLTVRILGTPAEEGGGGKILMLERGAFSGVDAAMMVHPGPTEVPQTPCLAVAHVELRYTGKEAHASAFPEQGVNAADALTVAQVSIGLLRQHLRHREQVHGIVTLGGEAPNVVPAHTAARYYVRAPSLTELENLEPKVWRCFEAGALATGSSLEIERKSPNYSEFVADEEMLDVYRRNAVALGRRLSEAGGSAISTDMANVSLALPAIHPWLGIDSLPAVNHQPAFAAAAASPAADQAVHDGALAMAWTAIDLALDPGQRDRLMKRRAQDRPTSPAS
jgi:amidohydrolase